MASTYSNLKFELIGTGEQVGTWGNTTNTNLGTAIEQAIVGTASVSFSSADVTLTLTNTNAAQNARALRLNLTGTSGGARNLILGSGCQIDKPYIVNNGLADTVTVKNTTGTGVAVPAGKTMWVYNNGTNVVDAVTHLSSLTLGSALPIASGGTGTTSTTFVNLASNVTGTLPVANGGTGAATLTGVVKGNGTSAFTAGTVNLSSEVTGTLPVANGGTGQTTYTNGQLLIGNTTGNTLTKATLTAGTGISITNGTGSISIAATNNGTVTSVGGTGTVQGLTLSGTVTSSGNLTLGGALSAVSLTTQVSGTLPIGNGGTGATTLTANNVLLGNGTSAPLFVAPGTSGNVLTSNGTTWTSAAAPAPESFPAGTRMIFAQNAAPTGWTKDTSNYNQHAMRIVTGTAGGTGGSVDFTTAFASQTPSGSVSVSGGSVGNTTLSTPVIPSHSHPGGASFTYQVALGPSGGPTALSASTGATGGGGAHSHPFSGQSATFSGNAINLAVKYLDVITATKN